LTGELPATIVPRTVVPFESLTAGPPGGAVFPVIVTPEISVVAPPPWMAPAWLPEVPFVVFPWNVLLTMETPPVAPSDEMEMPPAPELALFPSKTDPLIDTRVRVWPELR
jgi:hypothetical protein